MAALKHISSTAFKYVNRVSQNGKEFYFARITQYRCSKSFDDLRQAAKWVDMKLIEKGKEPVNILHRCAIYEQR